MSNNFKNTVICLQCKCQTEYELELNMKSDTTPLIAYCKKCGNEVFVSDVDDANKMIFSCKYHVDRNRKLTKIIYAQNSKIKRTNR